MSRHSMTHQVIRASAGSGKTHQLTNRYLSLLAAGVEPSAILATTFTRKAAGEIVDRVLQRLAAAAGDVALASELSSQLELPATTSPDYVALLRAMVRNLHRVRIGTLDSFFIALAGSFSLELGLPPGWSICEPADDQRLRQEALERLLDSDDVDILIALFQRLTHGHAKRGVHGELSKIVKDLYEIHQGTVPDAWRKIIVPPQLSPANLERLLMQIETFDLEKNTRMKTARSADLECVGTGDWEGLLGKGLCGKVASSENAYFKKPIPDELIGRYRELIQHARSFLIQPLAEQTTATREFLDRFHGELWAFKQTTGALRFGEINQALVNAVQLETLAADSLSFRLDGKVEHLLLDEFQDTSQPQWNVLKPMASGIARAPATEGRSFFCVGDVKQAIYGWRGGMAEIFNTLETTLGILQPIALNESRRSAQPIIDAVNQVFGKLGQFELDDKYRAGLDAWSQRFAKHETFKKNLPGYVCLGTGPMQQKDQSLGDHRQQHCAYVATKIREIVQQTPGRSLGVLCRKNATVGRMIYELRALGIEASEEGGNPLTDSPAVEVILSLFTLADHPGHSIAWFHLQNSPIADHLRAFASREGMSRQLRRELLAKGYGAFVQSWAERLAPACNRRDRSRLQQLVEMAYDFQTRSTLRADDFVSWVEDERKLDPSAANVRVMTVHGAKGLEFDIVVLPELDAKLVGQPPAFVVDRDTQNLDVTFVCRYADELIQGLLEPEQRRAFDLHRQHSVEESLSGLYVAMTRAIHAMYLFVPGPRPGKSKNSGWYHLLLQTLAPGPERTECAQLAEFGDVSWYRVLPAPQSSASVTAPLPPASITFGDGAVQRRRGQEHAAPSRREGGARVLLDRLFNPSEGTGMAAGTLYHAWFEAIDWLDDAPPTDATLRAAADKLRKDLPAETWSDLDRLLDTFRGWLQNPQLSGVLRRTAYAGPKQPGFPSALARCWIKTMTPQQVERERRFLVREGAGFLNGSLDRIVWLGEGGRTIAADVIDFKTDALKPGDAKAVAERTEHYRPQLDAYRLAVARLADLPVENIATRLVFTFAGCVVEV